MVIPRDINLNQPIRWAHPLNRGRVAWWLTFPQRFGAPLWWDMVAGLGANLKGITSGYGWVTPSNPGGSGSVRLDGVQAYVNTNFQTIDTAQGTFCLWVNPQFTYNDGVARYIARVYYSGVMVFDSTKYSDNNWYVGWYNNAEYRVILAASASNCVENAWQFYAVAWGSAGTKFYRNGALLGSNATAPVTPTGLMSLYLGAYYNAGVTGYTPLSANDISIFNRTLSQSEIQALYWASQEGYPGFFHRRKRNVLDLVAPTASVLVPNPFISRPRSEPAYFE